MQTQQASQQQIQQEPEEGKQHGTLRLFLAILGFIINVTVIVLYCTNVIKDERREARQVYSIVTNSFLEKAKKNAGYHKFKKMHRTRESRNLFLRRFLR